MTGDPIAGPPPAPTGDRVLGLWPSVFVLIGSTVGSGIILFPAAIATSLPSPSPFLIVWAVGGAIVLSGALVLGEIGSAYPEAGGVYAYIREGWGRPLAFLCGWAELALIRPAAIGIHAITFAKYMLEFIAALGPRRNEWWAEAAVASGIIVLTAAINCRGVKFGSAVNVATTVARLGGIGTIVAIALVVGFHRHGTSHYREVGDPGALSAIKFGMALVAVLWVYDGWADLCFMANRVKDPARTLPWALMIGTLAVTVLFFVANVAYLAVFSIEEIQTRPLIAAEIMRSVAGNPGKILATLTVVVALFGTINAGLLTTPYVPFAMARDGMLFRWLAGLHPLRRTPQTAILWTASCGILFVLASYANVDRLADVFVAAFLPFYALGVGAVFRLRRRDSYRPAFRAVGYPFTPCLFIAAALAMLLSMLLHEETQQLTMIVMAITGLGIPIYAVFGRRSREPIDLAAHGGS
jgi:amino acid transporter